MSATIGYASSRSTSPCYAHRMPDQVPRTEQDILDDLLESAQRLAIDVIEYPPANVMR